MDLVELLCSPNAVPECFALNDTVILDATLCRKQIMRLDYLGVVCQVFDNGNKCLTKSHNTNQARSKE